MIHGLTQKLILFCKPQVLLKKLFLSRSWLQFLCQNYCNAPDIKSKITTMIKNTRHASLNKVREGRKDEEVSY